MVAASSALGSGGTEPGASAASNTSPSGTSFPAFTAAESSFLAPFAEHGFHFGKVLLGVPAVAIDNVESYKGSEYEEGPVRWIVSLLYREIDFPIKTHKATPKVPFTKCILHFSATLW